jgi:hypothetical protein
MDDIENWLKTRVPELVRFEKEADLVQGIPNRLRGLTPSAGGC